MKNCIKFIFIVCSLLLTACASKCDYYRAQDGRIMLGDQPQYYIGTNVWYAPLLAQQDFDRFSRELDTLSALGINNLRIMATDENFEGLDICLAEMHKRGMSAVLYLNNAWEWTPDSYRGYLEKAGAGAQPHPAKDGYVAYMNSMSKFAANEKAMALYHEHVRAMVQRYKDHPAIFSWQICNEPRPFAKDATTRRAFIDYIHSTAKLIKSIDPNHMVSTGNEGSMGCEEDMSLFVEAHNIPEIDYLTIHIWPYNWGWIRANDVVGGLQSAIRRSEAYINSHIESAQRMNKAIVIEEFGYPRDGFEYLNSSSTKGRDDYYRYIFSQVLKSAKEGGRVAGCNTWAWSGYAKQTPGHQFWQEGDDLCGDPSQEAQGLNSVYITDQSTIAVIAEYSRAIAETVTLFSPVESGWLFTSESRELEVIASSQTDIDTDILLTLVSDLSLMSEQKDTIMIKSRRLKAEKGGYKLMFNLSELAPGFYQASLGTSNKGSEGRATWNIGIEPERISSPQDKEPDFDNFWNGVLAELSKVEMEPKLTLLAEHSNEQRNIYRVEIKSLDGALMGGYYAEPVADGEYPVKIEYMGYGADPYIFHPSSEPQTIQFLVSVRDQGIFKPGNSAWIQRGLESKESFYYRGAFADVIRAIDFIDSREKADKSRIFAQGESQGGAFTFVAAALDKRIRAAAPAVPFLGDYPDYAKIASFPMQEILYAAEQKNIPLDELYRTLSYFDLKNMVDKVECPIYMAFGLQDPVCPPHTNFAEYNMLKGEKRYFCVPTCGHAMWQERSWDRERAEFFKQF